MQKYKRKYNTVRAIQLDFEAADLNYKKWGGIQRAYAGDWLVMNAGEVYTVERKSFAATYVPAPANKDWGLYTKVGFVWAFKANHGGTIGTKEGISTYAEGDFVVFNKEDSTDGYCVKPDKFLSMYEPVEP